ncbi:MAG TPA: MlaD family protein, partial [Burkholderiales bacterium]
MKRESVNYALVGSFVLLMFVALLYGLYRVTGHQRQQDTYYISLANVAGISDGSTVSYEGYPVGNVTS